MTSAHAWAGLTRDGCDTDETASQTSQVSIHAPCGDLRNSTELSGTVSCWVERLLTFWRQQAGPTP